MLSPLIGSGRATAENGQEDLSWARDWRSSMFQSFDSHKIPLGAVIRQGICRGNGEVNSTFNTEECQFTPRVKPLP